MKKIGLIGGMSWESSQVYYKIMNERVRDVLGGFHSARCVMDSVDFAEIERLQREENWETLDGLMVTSAKNLANAGAEMIVIATNTMHLSSDAIKKHVKVPILHIARVTAQKVRQQGLDKVLLLGTKFTMEKDFFKTILTNEFGIQVIVPNDKDREIVHHVIYNELVHGVINAGSRGQYVRIIYEAIKNGAQGVILGCTEIPLLIHRDDVSIPTFDTTRIHAESAVDLALNLSFSH